MFDCRGNKRGHERIVEHHGNDKDSHEEPGHTRNLDLLAFSLLLFRLQFLLLHVLRLLVEDGNEHENDKTNGIEPERRVPGNADANAANGSGEYSADVKRHITDAIAIRTLVLVDKDLRDERKDDGLEESQEETEDDTVDHERLERRPGGENGGEHAQDAHATACDHQHRLVLDVLAHDNAANQSAYDLCKGNAR